MQYRHGDLLLLQVDPPERADLVERGPAVVLARGEATGHAHVLTAAEPEAEVQILKVPGLEDLVIDLKTGAVLSHEEHATLHIPAGYYQLRRQREYAPAPLGRPRWRRVRD